MDTFGKWGAWPPPGSAATVTAITKNFILMLELQTSISAIGAQFQSEFVAGRCNGEVRVYSEASFSFEVFEINS